MCAPVCRGVFPYICSHLKVESVFLCVVGQMFRYCVKFATLATERQHCQMDRLRVCLLGGVYGFFQLLDLSNRH